MIVETVRLSQKAKDQLVTLKRKTGIPNWNTLCRWALCRSLAEPTCPPLTEIPADSNVEMTWSTFGGPYAEIYTALVKYAGKNLEDSDLSLFFRAHLHRGIGYLAGECRNIVDLTQSVSS